MFVVQPFCLTSLSEIRDGNSIGQDFLRDWGSIKRRLHLRGRTSSDSKPPWVCNRVFPSRNRIYPNRSEEHTSELQSHSDLVCRLLLEKKKKKKKTQSN